MGSSPVLFASALFYALLLQGECITGGSEAAPHSRPYMVSLQLNGKHNCGAFLIANQWIMSAAHCFKDNPSYQVVLGAHNLYRPEDTKQTFDMNGIYIHPDYNPVNFNNDIALVKLSQPVIMTDSVKPLKFLRGGEINPNEGDAVDTAGWGSLNNLGSRPNTLQELNINIMERWLCSRSDYYGKSFTDNMLCAALTRKDTCDGDSGGPLLYKGIAVGITSNGGKKCGSFKKPGLYTIISHYDTWITSIMHE